MSSVKSDVLEVKKITVTDTYLQQLAERYIKLRSAFTVDEAHPIFKNIGFSTAALEKVIRENTKPVRTLSKGRGSAMRDIYRSDLGELLLTMYFEENHADGYVLPLKNIWDREHSDLPGRGFDGIGYKVDGDRVKLLLGEAKVSHAKSVPPVVDYNEDSLYNTHLKHRTDKEYLLRKLSNFVKKLVGEHAAIMQYIAFCLSQDQDGFDTVYGCCLVRDASCLVEPADFGKFSTDCNPFRPGHVHFVIFCFDKGVQEVIDSFHSKVAAA